ncbi:hypothetical protein PRN20_18295 [Devosia sp. ZB163]|uniref:hypothetical protein n=1 Tax=Devosia sp. ZB163 TaxID=3025938 RepID=UPI0023619524|nr:hypothetical protein [Devosia sp. ZB163]MDC9825689.1 hypothetical protein [Devosia sp. ZB163]
MADDVSFTPEQLRQLASVVKAAVREELADSGLRLDGSEHQDEAREDFRFLRRLRIGWDGTAAKIGNWVLVGVLVVAGSIIATGFWTWINSGGKTP